MRSAINIGDLVSNGLQYGWVISDLDQYGFYAIEWSDGWITRAARSITEDYKYNANLLLKKKKK